MAHMRTAMINATRDHAKAHVEKHRMNVEVYLQSVGCEHSDVMDAIEKELEEMDEISRSYRYD